MPVNQLFKFAFIICAAFCISTTLFAINTTNYQTAQDDSSKANFSNKGGFYDATFSLTLSVPDKSYDLIYTIDGSNPQNSPTAKNGGKFTSININPASTSGRAKTPGFIVRASLKKPEGNPLLPITHTYIFLSEVLKQKHPGGNWPTSNVNGQIIDLEMDDEVTTSPQYQREITDALKDLPSVSVVTDLESLFDPKTGIYVNAMGHGPEWERFCSVELLNPNSNPGFNINAGLRIRGGWSRHNDYPKHAFRLFFREEYGNAKLNFPLFEDEGVNEFDKIDLRCAQNYAWSNGLNRNTMVREVFSRDSQRDMGQPYTRSRYYHLYLNGMYWGIYQTQERSEARFGESYFGGSTDDYDVIKVNTDDYQYDIEATDGNLDAWEVLWDMCQKGFQNNRDYFILEGKDETGTPIKGKEKLLDIDNLIDYMITIFYAGNFDAPTSSFRGNRDPNNFYALFRRDDKTQGFIFFNHDAEHSLMYETESPGIGLEENRVQLNGMHVDNFNKFHPQWLHHKLSENAEYRQRFADRAYLHFYNDGVFTPYAAEERFMKRAKQIELAVIAESARWGDAKRGGKAYTKDDDWKPEIEAVVNNFFPYRTDIVINQLTDAKLLNNIQPAVYIIDGVRTNSNTHYFNHSAQINISATNSGALIYITSDGSDPRLPGGSVNPNARKLESGESISIRGTTVFTSRVKQGSDWSPMKTVRFVKHYEDYNNLQVTELYFWPADSIIGEDTVSAKKFEFIELKNIGGHAVDLSRLKFHSAIDFQFLKNAVLYPNSFYVLAANSKWFFERYGVSPSAVFIKAFSDSGEVVSIISDDGRIIIPFAYSPQNSWYEATAGTGFSIAAAKVYPTGNPNDDDFWKISSYLHGSPFADDTGFPLQSPMKNAVADGIMVYPNPTSNSLTITNKAESIVDFEIFTSTGQLVFSGKTAKQSTIQLRDLNLNPGIIMLRTNNNGKQSLTKIIYQP